MAGCSSTELGIANTIQSKITDSSGWTKVDAFVVSTLHRLNNDNGKTLTRALADYYIDPGEQAELKRFLGTDQVDKLAGGDGYALARTRLEWLEEHSITRWYRAFLPGDGNYSPKGRERFVQEILEIGPIDERKAAIYRLMEVERHDTRGFAVEALKKLLGDIRVEEADGLGIKLIARINDSIAATRQSALQVYALLANNTGFNNVKAQAVALRQVIERGEKEAKMEAAKAYVTLVFSLKKEDIQGERDALLKLIASSDRYAAPAAVFAFEKLKLRFEECGI